MIIFWDWKKEPNYTLIKDIRNLFKQKKTKAIKDKILRNITIFFKRQEAENYHKSVRVDNFCSNNDIEYESNSDRSKTLSVAEYLNKTSPCLKDIINNLKKCETWRIQPIIAITLFVL